MKIFFWGGCDPPAILSSTSTPWHPRATMPINNPRCKQAAPPLLEITTSEEMGPTGSLRKGEQGITHIAPRGWKGPTQCSTDGWTDRRTQSSFNNTHCEKLLRRHTPQKIAAVFSSSPYSPWCWSHCATHVLAKAESCQPQTELMTSEWSAPPR